MSSVVLLLGAFFGAALVTWLCVPAVIWLAKRQGWLDLPGGRRIHDTPTPSVGGLAMFVGMIAGSSVYGVVFGWKSLVGVLSVGHLVAFFAPCLLVFLVGLLDDIRGLSPVTRLAVEAIAAVFVIQAGYQIDAIAAPWGPPIQLGILAYPVTMLWIVGVTNAFNLIDGVDGLLATVGIVGLLGVAVVGLWGQMVGTPAIALALAGALLGILPWNWRPAKIFLGDSGSLVVGFTMAAWSLKVSRNINGAISIHIPLLLCALPIAETFLTLARRYVSGQPFFVGDRSHIHHVLVKKGLPVPRTVLLMSGVAALFALAAFVSRSYRDEVLLATFVGLVAVAFIGLRHLGYIELRLLLDRLRQALKQPRRGLPHLLAVARAGAILQEVSSLDELPTVLEEAREGGGFLRLEVELTGVAGSPWVAEGEPEVSEEDQEPQGLVDYRLPLRSTGSSPLGWVVARRTHTSWSPAPLAQDLRRYVVEPLAAKLGPMIESPPEAQP